MRKLIFILIVFIPFLSFSQNEKAKKILDKVSEKTASYPSIKAEFNFIMENLQEDIKEESFGKLWTKDDMYKLKLLGRTEYFNGKTKWTHLVDEEEVTISNTDGSNENEMNPAKLLTIYKEGFKYYYKQERYEKGRALHVIDLIPKDLDKDYSRIRLKIDKDKNLIYSMKRFGKDGNYYTIEVVKYTLDKVYKDTMFSFKKSVYPDVEVIDLR